MSEETGEKILEEIKKMTEALKIIKKDAEEFEWSFEYEAERNVEEIEKAMLIINYYKGV